ncbi:hypothetical protein ALNOE001_00690 [Candidatus Methanobinarius endosymbioticus]|uniref:DUF2283 domain-containing protein n=1 Tax=Candidatus Methanobinarius endosymbioticus TaxID=2006182 RepID=A0A366MGP9_9EURY|nr:hypothetical protein ALNOE001_00690 [Candidatus Methanobinarius endosymbioticus]
MNIPVSVSYTYDSDADVLFIKTENYKHETIIQLNNNVIMDFNKKENL